MPDSAKRSVEALTIKLSGGELGAESLDELEAPDPAGDGRPRRLPRSAGPPLGERAAVAHRPARAEVRGSAGAGGQRAGRSADRCLLPPGRRGDAQAGGDPHPPQSQDHTAHRRIRALHAATLRCACELLLPALPQLARLGRQCKFQGWIVGDQFAGPWQGKVVGQFSDVDLESLLADYPPQRLSGAGQLLVNAAIPRRAAGDGNRRVPRRTGRDQPIAVGCGGPALQLVPRSASR